MRRDRLPDRVGVRLTIVGGGVHGVHLAVRLLDDGLVEPQQLRIVEPNGLLAEFRRTCRQCGMGELRSPYVHHVGRDPFSLRDFARERGREDELVPSTVGAERPTVAVFFDHANWICDRYELESTVVGAMATDIVETDHGVSIETTDGQFTSEWCVLAIGNSRSYSLPQWASGLSPTAPVTHVWDPGFDPDAIGGRAAVGIVGGGITAAQLATTIAQPGRQVTVFARSPFRVESLEASEEWMHFSGVCDQLHALPPASRDRAQTIETARHDGTIPPHVFRRLRRAIDRGAVDLHRSAIAEATAAGGTVVVTCVDGTALCLDRLVCATGFGSPYDSPLFRRLRDRGTLQTGYRGAPVLDDETLRWRRQNGALSRIAVSGIAAQQVLGPFGRNIIGARRAGELIAGFLATECPTGAGDSNPYHA